MEGPRGRPPSKATSQTNSGCHATISAASVQRARVNTAALRRLVELHHRAWLTRAELEAEFGAPYWRLAELAATPYWRLS